MQSDTVHLENAEIEQNVQNTMEDDDKCLKLSSWAKKVCHYMLQTQKKWNLLRGVNDAKEGRCGLHRCRKL